MGFLRVLHVYDRKGAHMIGATADGSVGGPEKTTESLRDRFGCFGVVLGPNKWPMGSFERGDLKLSPSSVKPAKNRLED